MIDVVFGVLLTFHIGSVIVWLGSSILFSYVIGPSLDLMKDDSRRDFLLAIIPRFSKFAGASSLSTVVSGILIAGYVFGVNTYFLPSGVGLFFLLGGAMLGVVALIIGLTMILPLSQKLVKLLHSEDGENSGVLQAQTNIRSGARAVTILLSLVLVLMVLSQYV